MSCLPGDHGGPDGPLVLLLHGPSEGTQHMLLSFLVLFYIDIRYCYNSIFLISLCVQFMAMLTYVIIMLSYVDDLTMYVCVYFDISCTLS